MWTLAFLDLLAKKRDGSCCGYYILLASRRTYAVTFYCTAWSSQKVHKKHKTKTVIIRNHEVFNLLTVYPTISLKIIKMSPVQTQIPTGWHNPDRVQISWKSGFNLLRKIFRSKIKWELGIWSVRCSESWGYVLRVWAPSSPSVVTMLHSEYSHNYKIIPSL